MDVSDPSQKPAEPTGDALIATLADLSGLPEDMTHKEVEGILGVTGHSAAKSAKDLTLEELRASMLAYLEMLHQEFNSDESAQELEADTGGPGSIPTPQS